MHCDPLREEPDWHVMQFKREVRQVAHFPPHISAPPVYAPVISKTRKYPSAALAQIVDEVHVMHPGILQA